MQARLLELVNMTATAKEMQERRDAWLAFQSGSSNWLVAVTRAWQAPQPGSGSANLTLSGFAATKFELMDNDVMDDQILASRLALRLLDFASWELNDLRLRVQNLEQISELPKNDILRPEVLARLLIEQWVAVKLPRATWTLVQDVAQSRLAEQLLVAYHAANEFLVQNGVMAEIDLRPLVKRTPSAVSAKGEGGNPQAASRQSGSGAGGQFSGASGGSSGYGGPPGSGTRFASGSGNANASRSPSGNGNGNGNASSQSENASYGASPAAGGRVTSNAPGGSLIRPVGTGNNFSANNQNPNSNAAGVQPQQPGFARPSQGGSPQDETRMQTATTPLARARMRAQGVMGTLKRLISNHVAGFDDTRATSPSPQLARALVGNGGAGFSTGGSNTLQMDEPGQFYGTVHVEQAASAMRKRTSELKKAATTQSEKATIEIVALMFQSILAEDRIPAGIRVWFARLQMPVLRLAISEPEFFSSLEHPARQLIDRMGSCVLGFNADVSGGALEVEVKRVVQVIEQYPETGRRVFQLVYDEFQKFLSKFLSENGNSARAVSVAQQMEQKETMAIQFTIEMRNMLKDIPVRDEIREFLFKVWAEALAISAMRNGPQHAETLVLKGAAADLVWASSAKPDRADRAKVIADLPMLLQLLRSGMTMLGMEATSQDEHIKVISDTLADAFMSKNSAIAPERIEQMAKRLTNLEDYLSDEDIGDLPLDTEALVMMLGIDTTDIEVITDGGSQPSDAIRAWANELQLGAWFSLDHNGRVAHVQFAWRSDRKQLHLFASSEGLNYLIQARRLAAYLQAGLLVPTEEEALTVRATRDALVKLEANPERLLD
jgi:Protein of unknown function (DUF1631)